MNQTSYLIVEQQQKPAEELPELLKELSQKHQLDIYQARQRLVGRGLSLLANGAREPLEKTSIVLQQYGFSHWLVEPSKPKFIPHRLRSLAISNEQLSFHCQKKEVIFAKGCSVLAVFAEMSGQLADKSIKQLLSSNAYRGRDNVRHLEEHKILKTILQGKPLLDLYLLDQQKQIIDAIRVHPGKFDPKGLGDRATVSSVQNLKAILSLAEEYADQFTLVTDFGLVNLPGCILRRDDPDNPETQRQNQISLARYGWLLADLQRAGSINPLTSDEDSEDHTGTVAAALLHQNPGLLASGLAEEVLPVAKEIAQELNKATGDRTKTQSASPDMAEEGLPAPPHSTTKGQWRNPAYWLGSAGATVAVVSFFLFEHSPQLFRRIFHFSFDAGIGQLLLAGLMSWGGFYFIHIKRQIENTPTSRIRSAAMGMVEVKGRAIRQYALLAPMSHIPCVYYRLTKYRRDNEREWKVTSVSSSNNVPFYIEDDTGRVEVDPAGCRVSAGSKHEGTPGQIGLMPLTSDSNERWVEEVVVEGTLLYVLGYASVKKAIGPSLTERKVEALRELKRNPQNLEQFDSDGDGKISEDEWDNARAAVEEKVIRDELQNKQRRKKQEEHIVIGKRKGRPLIIAETHSEEHLTRRYAMYTVPLFVLAIAASIWGLNSLLHYLK